MLVIAALAGAGSAHARHLSGAADIIPVDRHHEQHAPLNTQAPDGTISSSGYALVCCPAPLPDGATPAASVKTHPPLRLMPGESRPLSGRTLIPDPAPPRIIV
ncbi:MAG: hypothetical protein A3G18_01350 [Rhodospirillales bacterium RIFCSPLOWO2_12_FULL_58_28]|nr:MAG: hypothetical protein A3H92_04550 [Rhodospirillales bacterium RIFCSPLOWO2_02_FULL_58_16]OHC78046.1 MAG: hypothetical protein A3G18_01350 [Rhodospirillales bacterium RIFCSPLOWO2_12_FULL_58_28]